MDGPISFLFRSIGRKKYKLITLHHSFEHMDQPDIVLGKLMRLLDDDGMVLIRIPICGSKAWEKYKENWFQIDAPRHFYLYSRDSFIELCKRNNFLVKEVLYDSNYKQFAYSKLYKQTNDSLKEIGDRKCNKCVCPIRHRFSADVCAQ